MGLVENDLLLQTASDVVFIGVKIPVEGMEDGGTCVDGNILSTYWEIETQRRSGNVRNRLSRKPKPRRTPSP